MNKMMVIKKGKKSIQITRHTLINYVPTDSIHIQIFFMYIYLFSHVPFIHPQSLLAILASDSHPLDITIFILLKANNSVAENGKPFSLYC